MTIVGTNPDAVIGGIDTHAEVHVAAVVNHVGGVLGIESFPTTIKGYRQLVSWRAAAAAPHRAPRPPQHPSRSTSKRVEPPDAQGFRSRRNPRQAGVSANGLAAGEYA